MLKVYSGEVWTVFYCLKFKIYRFRKFKKLNKKGKTEKILWKILKTRGLLSAIIVKEK